MAAGIDELALPSITVPDLFRLHKIVTTSGPPIGYGPFQGMTLGSSPQFSTSHPTSPTPTPANPLGSGNPLRNAKATNTGRRGSLPSSYSSVLQTAPVVDARSLTPELDSDTSSSSDISDGPPTIGSRSPSPTTRMKHVNPNIVESNLSIYQRDY
jgi:hypothetical protein